MIKLGLTGSIGMGKSTTAAMFAARGVPVYDADAAVHAAYAAGGEAVAPLEWAFGHVIAEHGGVDRAALRERVVGDAEMMRKLESIIHPIVARAQRSFLETAEADGAELVLLDIPLLFETGGDRRVDAVVVVSAPPEVQRARVLSRPGMTESAFEAILAKQTPDAIKRRRADFVINTGYGRAYAEAQVDQLLTALRPRWRAPEACEDTCEKSSSTRRRPAWIRRKAIASSKSGASSL
ncbi:dephospho-CoA kinase [bacterium]|nr:dephospho-CoA kinase [bacterium]